MQGIGCWQTLSQGKDCGTFGGPEKGTCGWSPEWGGEVKVKLRGGAGPGRAGPAVLHLLVFLRRTGRGVGRAVPVSPLRA